LKTHDKATATVKITTTITITKRITNCWHRYQTIYNGYNLLFVSTHFFPAFMPESSTQSKQSHMPIIVLFVAVKKAALTILTVMFIISEIKYRCFQLNEKILRVYILTERESCSYCKFHFISVVQLYTKR
jgi:hypothetical protein